MAFVSDTFTDTNGVDLTAHTGETGASWTRHAASNNNEGSFPAEIQSNRVAGPNESATGLYYASGTPSTAEYDVEADFFVADDTDLLSHGIVARLDTSANTMYLVRYNGTQWGLFKAITGTFTSLGSFAQTLNTNDTGTVKLEIRDADKKVYIDGVERISSTNNEITGAGRAGVRLSRPGLHFDNFTATDAGGGGATPTAADNRSYPRGVGRGITRGVA